MTHRLALRKEAREDIASAASWYDDQESGLGRHFVVEAREIFRQIAESPARFRSVSQEVRQASLHRFPYAVYFSVEPEKVIILAVIHKRRDPNTWRQRIQL